MYLDNNKTQPHQRKFVQLFLLRVVRESEDTGFYSSISNPTGLRCDRKEESGVATLLQPTPLLPPEDSSSLSAQG